MLRITQNVHVSAGCAPNMLMSFESACKKHTSQSPSESPHGTDSNSHQTPVCLRTVSAGLITPEITLLKLHQQFQRLCRRSCHWVTEDLGPNTEEQACATLQLPQKNAVIHKLKAPQQSVQNSVCSKVSKEAREATALNHSSRWLQFTVEATFFVLVF